MQPASTTTLFLKRDDAPGLAVAIRLGADGRELSRKEFDWPSSAAQVALMGGSVEGHAVGIHGQQVSPVSSGAQAGEVGSELSSRNLGNPPTPKGHGAGVESGPPALSQGDLFAAPTMQSASDHIGGINEMVPAPAHHVGEAAEMMPAPVDGDVPILP